MSSTKITGFVPFGPVGASGMSNHMRVYQKNGRDFFRLSDIAGAPPIQRAAAGAPASGSAYASTVQSLREQIQTSATSRSLLDRVRDPKNHTAKTQILQLVQLIAEEEKQGLSGGEADRALLALMEDSSTRPLLTSALASAMGGAPWVAERNTKIADGVLNMNTLASDAIRTCIWLGRMPREISKDAGEIFSQLRSHGAFSFSPSRLLKGLQKLSPGLRCEFYRLALNSGQRTLPPIQVFLAAKAKASWDDFFAAIKETDVNKRLELYNSIKASGQTNLPPIQDFVVCKSGAKPDEFFAAIKETDVNKRLELYNLIKASGQRTLPLIQDFVVCKSGAKPDEFFAAIKDMSARDRLKLVNYVKADRVQYPAYQSLVPGDVIAGKQNAKPEEFWDVILKEYPMQLGSKKINSYQALNDQVITPMWNIACQENEINTVVQGILSASRAKNPRAISVFMEQLNAHMNALRQLQMPDMQFVNQARASLNTYAQNLGVLKFLLPDEMLVPKPRFQNERYQCHQPKPFAQGQMLGVMRALGEVIPNMNLRCNRGMLDNRGISNQLRDAVADVKSYLYSNFVAQGEASFREKADKFLTDLGMDPKVFFDFLSRADDLTTVPSGSPTPAPASTPSPTSASNVSQNPTAARGASPTPTPTSTTTTTPQGPTPASTSASSAPPNPAAVSGAAKNP